MPMPSNPEGSKERVRTIRYLPTACALVLAYAELALAWIPHSSQVDALGVYLHWNLIGTHAEWAKVLFTLLWLAVGILLAPGVWSSLAASLRKNDGD
jgi:hypothetical protein